MTTTTAPELRTHRAFGFPEEIDFTPAITAAKAYIASSDVEFTHQHSRRFFRAVKNAYAVMVGESGLKSRQEDPTGHEAVRRVLAERAKA